MSLLSVVQDVCEVVGVERLTTIFGSLNAQRTQQEMLACANEMAQQMARDTRDWSTLTGTATLIGDGVATDFAMPDDFWRMLLNGNVWSSLSALVPLRFIGSYDEWLRRSATAYWDSRGSYIILGDRMHIQPTLGAGMTATFGYISNLCIKNTAGARLDRFMADDDSYVLDERLLKLNMIWKWKSNKGSPYAEDMGTFFDAFAMKAGHDQPAPVLIGGVPISSTVNATIAYPWPLPTP